jgi:hypothetical protein
MQPLHAIIERARRLPADQRGSISIASVFAILLLTMLLGMISNAGQQVDQKVKLQNAADATAWSGGVVLARSMNTLAFTNHLLSDVFALTAYMREARDQGSRQLAPEILDNWERVGPIFAESEFEKFANLGQAITEKVPYEREMVETFSEWAAAASEKMLPVLEDILENRRIPEFQRALVRTTPMIVQYTVDEVARRHGEAWPHSPEVHAVMWRTVADPVGGSSEEERRTLPVVDPVMDQVPNQQTYQQRAKEGRDSLAHTYLAHWNAESLEVFDTLGKMSQFANLWRIFTCGQLEKLLNEEYPDTNLPHVIRHQYDEIENLNDHLEEDFMFVSVVYRQQIQDKMPGIFKNPVDADSLAYAQIMIYAPRRRLVRNWQNDESEEEVGNDGVGGVPGEPANLQPPPGPPSEPADEEDDPYWVVRQWSGLHPGRLSDWSLWTQNWSMQLVPATAPRIPEILSTQPNMNGVDDIQLPNVRSLSEEEFQWISNH